LVGQALLVALNAKADGNEEGKANARKLIRLLQTSGGVGGRLRGKFTNQAQTTDFFSLLGLRNNTKMLGAGNLAAAVYQASWVEARPGDIGATNLLIPQANQMPLNRLTSTPEDIPADFKRKLKQADGKDHSYFRGYQQLDLVGVPIVGVPVQPGAQPHLVSAAEFQAGLNKFGTGDTVIPPNAFEYGSQKQDQFTAGNASAASRAVVGSLNQEFASSIPLGYILVHNPAGMNASSNEYPTSWGVLDEQLEPGNGGITVDSASGVFSSDAGLMNDWRGHNGDTSIDHSAEGPAHPPTDNLFNGSGDPATLADAHNINPSGSGPPCTDQNTVAGPLGEGSAPCSGMLNAFEKAYGSKQMTSTPSGQAKPLTAVEHAKADVIDKFNGCGYLSLSGAPSGSPNKTTTGYRKYKCALGAKCTWSPSVSPNKGQISDDGTISELIAQATGDGAAAEDFIRRRIFQIKPEADAAEISGILTTKVPLGSDMYIYMDNPKTSRTLKFSTTKPPGRTAAPTQTADGTPIAKSTSFQAQSTYVNPKHENGIHNQMYTCPGGGITVVDEAILTPSSGWNNMLGQLEFKETVTNNQAYYCCPD
jgi:hypothetical protein